MTGLPPGLYDASEPDPVGADDLLGQAQAQVATRGLEAALRRVGEHTARAREQEARDGLDPGTTALLDELSSAPDAPLEYRSLHRRVQEGMVTWEQVWSSPLDQAGGRRLVLDVVRVQAEQGEAGRRLFAEAEARGEHDDVQPGLHRPAPRPE